MLEPSTILVNALARAVNRSGLSWSTLWRVR
jgi:hypothetical protein